MRMKVDGLLWLKAETKEEHRALTRMARDLTFANPRLEKAIEMGAGQKRLKEIPEEVSFYEDRDGWLGVPRAKLDLDQCDLEEDSRSWWDKGVCKYSSNFFAREGQEAAVQAAVDTLHLSPYGGVLQANCGSGKTVMAIEVIRQLAIPAVVLVHKEFLARQWAKELKTFLPDAKVGFIWRDKCDSGVDHDAVICMVQSLLRRSYPQDALDSFGLLIADEVHRHGAVRWHKALSRFPAARRLGPTATPHRRDGFHVVYLQGIGDIFHVARTKRMTPELIVRHTETTVLRKDYYMPWNNKPNISKLVSRLAASPPRTAKILNDVMGALEAGRRPMVFTARLNHVNEMVKCLVRKGVHASKFVGGMSEYDEDLALEADVCVITYQKAREALDAPPFDTCFLATPEKDIEQPVGRVCREAPDKKHPLVLDYVDRRVPICHGMFKARMKVYTSLGIQRRGRAE